MSDLISNLQRLGDAEHDDLSVAHDALAEIVRLRILTVEQHDEIERLRQLLCKCNMRTRMVGDGCEFCNPQLAEELSKERNNE